MKPTAPLLFTTFAALALFACNQQPAPQLGVATADAVRAAAEPTTFPSCKDRNVVDNHGKPDGGLFVSKRVFLLQSSTFEPFMSSGYPPTGPTGPTADNSLYAADLIAAFNAAPPFFQEQLCGLDGVFVNLAPCKDPNNCTADAADNSWGYRETLDQNPQGPARRYIAISALLWSGRTHVDNFYDYETTLLHQLFKHPYGASWDGPQYGDPNPHANHPENTPTMTVLASLAHEFGHVLWHDTFRPVRSRDRWANDFSNFCEGKFFDESWQRFDGQRVDPPPPWREFGERSKQLHKPVIGEVQISLIDYAISQKHTIDRAYFLDGIYRMNGRWTSFFAAISPDEDFVETFKYYVLRKTAPPLKNLPITIPSIPPLAFNEDVPKDHDQKQVLKAKVKCFLIYH
jgi:hypothetical protein